VLPHAHALLLAGPHMGEGKNLVLDQRVELFEKALVVIRARLPILIWITRDTLEDTEHTLLALKKVLEKRRYAGQVFWVDTPLYYHSNRGLPTLYRDLCARVDEPFILHNDPEFIRALARPLKRNNIRTAILKELISLRSIVGLIFLGSLDRAHNYQRACRTRTHFRIYDGDEAHFLEHPSMSGTVSVGANLTPRAWQKITHSSLQMTGGQENYPDHLQQIWDLGRYLRSLKDTYQHMPVSIVKGALSDMGIIETPTSTLPAEDVEKPKNRLKELMAEYGDYPQAR
jgi:dihydrodipicolinate synthase/N-acetylneuraminate lyase